MKPRFKFRLSVRTKFIIFIASVLLIIFTVISYILVSHNTTTLHRSLEDQSRAFSALATKPIGEAFLLYQDSGRLRILQEIQNFDALDPNVVNVAIADVSGKLLFSQNQDFDAAISSQQAASFEPIYNFAAGPQQIKIIYPFIESFGQHRYSLVYSFSSAKVDQEVRQVVSSIVISSLLALIASILVTYFIMNRLFIGPLRQVAQTALLVSLGKLAEPVKLNRNDELGDLATAVAQMAATLQADIKKLQEVDKLKSEFMMIASHNLRTPISIVNGYIDTMRTLKVSAEIGHMIDVISANNQRLAAFAEDMLTISRVEAGDYELIKTELIDVAKLLSDIAAEFAIMANEEKIKFVTQLPQPPLMINASAPHLRNAVWNVLDNAMKFTKEGGRIAFSVSVEPTHLKITISDTGIGIDPAEMPKLFTKFHRATSTLEYNYEGTGIGLYVTKLLLTQMHGQISATSQLGKGSQFTIILPRQA